MSYEQLADQMMVLLNDLRACHHHPPINKAQKGEALALIFLAQKNVTSPTALAQEMGISSARVAVLLTSLENKGLVVRSIHPNDRRKITLTLSETGRNKAHRYYSDARNHAIEWLSRLSLNEAQQFITLAAKLVAKEKEAK